MKTFIVATDTDYTVLCLAENERQAEIIANIYYCQHYGEARHDWTAYEINSYLEDWIEKPEIIPHVMPIRSLMD